MVELASTASILSLVNAYQVTRVIFAISISTNAWSNLIILQQIPVTTMRNALTGSIHFRVIVSQDGLVICATSISTTVWPTVVKMENVSMVSLATLVGVMLDTQGIFVR